MDLSLITYFLPLHNNAFLAKLAEIVTILGEDTIIILVGAVLYWCIDPKAGQRMATVAVGGIFWTLGLKNLLQIPRPWDLGIIKKSDVIRAETATGYSFPSGHTASAVNVYGYFAMGAKTVGKVLLWLIVVLVGLSRIFLGCHTSYDVIAAIVLNTVWIYLGSYLYDKLMAKGESNIFWFLIPMAFAGLSLLNGFDDDIIKMCAFGGVAILGIYLERRYVHYEVKGNVSVRILEFLIGLLVVVGLKFWPKAVGSEFYELLWLKAINYALIAFWLSCAYPWLLQRFNARKQ